MSTNIYDLPSELIKIIINFISNGFIRFIKTNKHYYYNILTDKEKYEKIKTDQIYNSNKYKIMVNEREEDDPTPNRIAYYLCISPNGTLRFPDIIMPIYCNY